MGDRRNIKIIENEGGTLYLYSHWGGSELHENLQAALSAGKNRWDDEPYLSRIILSYVVGDSWKEETGWGLSTYRTDHDYPDLEVNMKAQTVSVGGEGSGAWWSFATFADLDFSTLAPGLITGRTE